MVDRSKLNVNVPTASVPTPFRGDASFSPTNITVSFTPNHFSLKHFVIWYLRTNSHNFILVLCCYCFMVFWIYTFFRKEYVSKVWSDFGDSLCRTTNNCQSFHAYFSYRITCTSDTNFYRIYATVLPLYALSYNESHSKDNCIVTVWDTI